MENSYSSKFKSLAYIFIFKSSNIIKKGTINFIYTKNKIEKMLSIKEATKRYSFLEIT